MANGAGGVRKLEDEKQLLSELGKLFHTVKAHYKERENVRKAAAAGAADGSGKKSAKKEEKKRTRRRRKNVKGGSVWITLKGGFSAAAVPAPADSRRIAAKCFSRGAMAERRRVAALAMAESYIESAWAAAEDAGIAQSGTTTCEEGVVYMREQVAVAVKMLDDAEHHAPGTYMRRVVEESAGVAPRGSGKGAAAGTPSSRVECAVPADRAEVDAFTSGNGAPIDWEDIATRELAIRQNPYAVTGNTASTSAALAEETFKSTVADAGHRYYYRLAEPAAPRESAGDIAATKCIVRVRNSQRQKHTAILATQKAVNYFKTNFMQVLRKELSNSRLPRGAVEEGGPAGTNPTGENRQAKQQQQSPQHSGKGKKRGKR